MSKCDFFGKCQCVPPDRWILRWKIVMRQVLSYASQIARAVLSYYGSFWLPLLLTELVPLPAATRMQVRQYFR